MYYVVSSTTVESRAASSNGSLFESGPTIFLCYISNMSDHVRNYMLTPLICRPIIICEDCEMLQNDLDLIQSRANKYVF